MHKLRPLVALFIRSVREDTRGRLPTILRATLICVILLILWANERSFTNRTAPGREFFSMVMVLNLAFIGIAALSIFPSAISEEKEDETLPLLRMTNLSPVAILFGKSTSRLMGALLLLAVQVPFTILAITLGGVSIDMVWSAYAILGSVTFFLCNLSLLTSVFSRTTMRAGFLTAAMILILYVLLPIGAAYYGARPTVLRGFAPPPPNSGWSQEFWTLVLQANPMWAMMQLLGPRGFVGGLSTVHIWINLIGGFVSFCVAWMIFDRFCTQSGETIVRPQKTLREGKRHRFKWVPRTWSRLPLAWKDFHFMIGGRFGFFTRLVLGAAIFLCVRWMVFKEARNFHPDRWEIVAAIVMSIAGGCAGLEVLLQAGRIFGVERRRQTLSGLVGLPWSTGKIIRQKILGILPCLLPWIILASVAAAFAWDPLTTELGQEIERAQFDWEGDKVEWAVMAYVFLQTILFLITIVWFSLMMRRGALPAAIAAATLWNIIFGVCADAVPHRDEFIAISVGIFLTLPVLVLACRGVYRRIQVSAAEDS